MVFNLSEALAAAERDEERPRGDARGGAGQPRRCQGADRARPRRSAMRDFEAAERAYRDGDPARSARAFRLSGARPAARESEPGRRARRALVEAARRAAWPGPNSASSRPGRCAGRAASPRRCRSPRRRPRRSIRSGAAQLIAELHDRLGDADARLRRVRGDEPGLGRGASRRRRARPIARRSRPTPRC